jgi:TRAP-type mannitol/chloroaromatic compound transport system substrate-binding protein
VAVQTGELDGIAWSGITEDYTVGWADVTNYFLTNNISGAWCGSFFANMDRWNELPDHLKELLMVCMEQSHYYRQWWYWGGEASLRVNGTKMKLTTIPDAEWQQVEDAAIKFWDEIAPSPRPRRRWWTSSRSTTRTCRRPGGHTATADPAATVAGAHPGVPRFAVTVAI